MPQVTVGQLFQENREALKLSWLAGEAHAGALLDSISFLSERDIPVCAHLGLTPQSVLRLGGYKVQGREQAAAKKLLADAHAVADAGADLLVLECVPSALAAEITRELAIPTIGIGAGPDCDGQILVLHDLLGMNSGHRRPRFVKNFRSFSSARVTRFCAAFSSIRNAAAISRAVLFSK